MDGRLVLAASWDPEGANAGDDVLDLARRLDIEERDVTATAVTINPRYRRRDNESVVDLCVKLAVAFHKGK